MIAYAHHAYLHSQTISGKREFAIGDGICEGCIYANTDVHPRSTLRYSGLFELISSERDNYDFSRLNIYKIRK